MIDVRPFTSNKDEWNRNLDSTVNPNVFALYDWGEYKSQSWSIERITFHDDKKFIGQAQIFFKQLGPFRFGWCSSGINLVDYDYLPAVTEALSHFYNLNRTYIRFNFLDNGTGVTNFTYDGISLFQPVKKTVNSGYTIRFFNLGEGNIGADFYSKNNKYYLKKALGNSLRFVFDEFEPEAFSKIHNSMVDAKALDHLRVEVDDLQKLQAAFGKKLKLAKVYSGDNVVAAALLILTDKLMYYYLAGSSAEGRKLSASFYLVDEILKVGKNLNLREFDFGGITPFKESAHGVNRFKLGFGGETINYVGERNLCRSKWLTKLFDFVVSKKIK